MSRAHSSGRPIVPSPNLRVWTRPLPLCPSVRRGKLVSGSVGRYALHRHDVGRPTDNRLHIQPPSTSLLNLGSTVETDRQTDRQRGGVVQFAPPPQATVHDCRRRHTIAHYACRDVIVTSPRRPNEIRAGASAHLFTRRIFNSAARCNGRSPEINFRRSASTRSTMRG